MKGYRCLTREPSWEKCPRKYRRKDSRKRFHGFIGLMGPNDQENMTRMAASLAGAGFRTSHKTIQQDGNEMEEQTREFQNSSS